MDAPEQAKKQPNSDTDQNMLRAFLADRDAQCPACGYNLRMLSKQVCPECGLPLKLTVGSDTPYKRAWAITLCLNAMIAGAGLFFLLITAVEGGPGGNDLLEYIWYVGPMVWIPTPLIIMGLRKWFCRQALVIQYGLIALTACWMIAIGVSLIISFG